MWKSRTLLLALLALLAGAGGYLLLAGGSVEPAVAGIETPFPGLPGIDGEDQAGGPLLQGEDGEEADHGRVALQAPDLGWGGVGNLVFEGRVVTPKGLPIPSAQVEVSLLGRRRRTGGAGPTGKARTDEQGRFRIALNGPVPSFWTASATFAGLAPDTKRGVARPGRTLVEVGDLVLGPGGVLSGVVVDREGNPVSKAVVSWMPSGRRRFFRGRGGSPGVSVLRAETNPAGLFQLVHVPRGEGKLLATHPAHPPGRSPLIRLQDGTVQDGIRILLPPGYILQGKVLAQGGGPLPGARVRTLPFRGGAGFRRGPSPSTLTDKEGKFRFPALPGGDYLVTAEAEGWQKAFQWVRLGQKSAPPPSLNFSLSRGRVLEGRVTDEKGNPLTVFSVAALPQSLAKGVLPSPPQEVRKKLEAGRGRNTSLPRFLRNSNFPGRPRESRSGRGKARDPARSDRVNRMLDRVLRRRGNLPPQVLDRIRRALSSGGKKKPDPMEDVRSRVLAEFRFRRPRPSRHPEGVFRLQGLLPGIYRIEVEAPGYIRKRSGPLDLTKETGISRITLALDPVLAVTGRVLAKDTGEPLAGARVFALPGPPPKDPVIFRASGGRSRGRRGRGPRGFWPRGNRDTTDRKGRFRIDGLSPGKWHFIALGRAYGMGESAAVVLEKGKKPAPLEILVPPGAVLSGKVTGWRREELTRMLVAAFGPDRRPHTCAVDAQGRFELKGLPAGEWSVLAVAGDPRVLVRAFFRGRNGAAGQVKVRLEEGGKAQVEVPLFRPSWGSLSGTLFRGGLPAAGYQVRLVPVKAPRGGNQPPRGGRPRRGRGGPMGRSGRGPRAEVDIQGAFFFPDVDAGAYTLEGSPKGRDWIPLGKVVIPVGHTVQVALTWPVGSVEGEVLLNGMPLAGARIRLLPLREGTTPGPGAGAFSSSPASFETRTGKDGSFKVKDVPPGTYSVEVRGGKRRSRAYFGPIRVFQDQVTRQVFTWNVCDLQVRVVDGDSGKPLKRCFVLVRPAGNTPGRGRGFRRTGFARTDGKGLALIRNVQEGEVRVLVFSRDHGKGEAALRLSPGMLNQVKIPMKKQAPPSRGRGNGRSRPGGRKRNGKGRRRGR